MTHVEKAIRDAVEKGGWGRGYIFNITDKSDTLWFSEPHSRPEMEEWLTKARSKRKGRVTLHAFSRELWNEALLDPAFWQSLGKARGWHIPVDCSVCDPYEGTGCSMNYNRPIAHWHRFVDHLASGADAESFFATLSNEETKS